MRAQRVVLGLSLSLLLGGVAVNGCGGSTAPALGIEGAGCYTNGDGSKSCNSQLLCVADVCRRPAQGSTAGAGGGTAGAGADSGVAGADGGAGRDAATDVETAADGAAAADAAATESGHDAATVESGHDSAGDDVTDGLVEVGSDAICAAVPCAENAPWSQIACACVPIVDGGARDGVSAIEAGDDAATDVGGDI